MFKPELLEELVSYRMPYGKYKDRLICDLPEAYLLWMMQQAKPKGKLGMLIGTMYEIRLNGLEALLSPLRNKR